MDQFQVSYDFGKTWHSADMERAVTFIETRFGSDQTRDQRWQEMETFGAVFVGHEGLRMCRDQDGKEGR